MTPEQEQRMPFYGISAGEFEACKPGFPVMLADEDYGVEWENLTRIAEQTDAADDWNAVMDMEAVLDHMIFEGKWE